MLFKRIICLALAAALIAGMALPVLADEEEPPKETQEVSETDAPQLEAPSLEVPQLEGTQLNTEGMDMSKEGESMSSSFDDLKSRLGSDSAPLSSEDIDLGLKMAYGQVLSSIGGDNEVNLSQAMSDVFGFSLKKNLSTDLTDLSALNLSERFDQGYLDMQFESLSKTMGENMQVNMDDLKGSSVNAVELFNNTYGDLYSQLSLMDTSIPKDFDPAKMLKNSRSMIDSTYSKAISSGSFGNIKDSISIGSIFSQASKGVSAPDLASESTLREMLSTANKGIIDKEYESAKKEVNSHHDNFDVSSEANKLWQANGGTEDIAAKAPIILTPFNPNKGNTSSGPTGSGASHSF